MKYKNLTLIAALSTAICNPNTAKAFCGCDCSQVDDAIIHVLLDGQELFVAEVNEIIAKINYFQQSNPVMCAAFLDYCFSQADAPITQQLLNKLKELHLVDTSATVSDTIKKIIQTIVEKNPDGSYKIWNLTDLINGQWLVPLGTHT